VNFHFRVEYEVSMPFAQVVVGSVNDWQKERQFKVLNERKEERGVKVIRDGVETVIDIKVCTSFILHSGGQFTYYNAGSRCRRYCFSRTWRNYTLRWHIHLWSQRQM
jgi:hypothetical protein